MSTEPLTDDEIAEFRRGAKYNPALERLAATIDSLRERAEAAERENIKLWAQVHEPLTHDAQVEAERDAALALLREARQKMAFMHGEPREVSAVLGRIDAALSALDNEVTP